MERGDQLQKFKGKSVNVLCILIKNMSATAPTKPKVTFNVVINRYIIVCREYMEPNRKYENKKI